MAEEVIEQVAVAEEKVEVKTEKKKFFKPHKNKKKVCAFCEDKNLKFIDYKDANRLRKFVTERGKILPRRISGTCAKHQRELTTSIKRSRNIALLPFTTE